MARKDLAHRVGEVAKKVQKDEKAEKEAIEQAVKDLNEAIMPIGAKMYEAVESDAEKSDDKSSKADKKAKKIFLKQSEIL